MRAFVILTITVVALVGLAALGSAIRSGGSEKSATPSITTLERIIAGQFPTATDKQGTGGVSVTVRDLRVLYVSNESDGDWHVAVTDGRVSVFITEITPPYQSLLGRPTANATIDEIGIAFCDTFHENESWHGDTCWEIHPITSWSSSP